MNVADGVFHCGAPSNTRDELKRRSLSAASALQALGVLPGQAVALLLRNDFTFFAASFAAAPHQHCLHGAATKRISQRMTARRFRQD